MTAIPEDVRERARGVLTGRRLAFDNEAGLAALIEAIAAFALSEREAAQREERARCAAIAKAAGDTWSNSRDPNQCCQEAAVDEKCEEIAAAILQEPKA